MKTIVVEKGYSNTIGSRYYMDPSVPHSGPVRVVKKADPEKLKAYYASQEYKDKQAAKKAEKNDKKKNRDIITAVEKKFIEKLMKTNVQPRKNSIR